MPLPLRALRGREEDASPSPLEPGGREVPRAEGPAGSRQGVCVGPGFALLCLHLALGGSLSPAGGVANPAPAAALALSPGAGRPGWWTEGRGLLVIPITRCWPAWEVDGGTGPLGHPHHQVLAGLGGGRRDGASRSSPSPGAGRPGRWTEGRGLAVIPITRCWPAWEVDGGTGPRGHPHHQVLAGLGGGRRDGASRSSPSPGAGRPGRWTEGRGLAVIPITRCWPAWEVDGGTGPRGHPHHQVLAGLGGGRRDGASRSSPSPGAGRPGRWTEGRGLAVIPITRCWPAWEVDGGTGPRGHPHHQVLAGLGGGRRDGASRSSPSPGAGRPGRWTEGWGLSITPVTRCWPAWVVDGGTGPLGHPCHQVLAGLGGGWRDGASQLPPSPGAGLPGRWTEGRGLSVTPVTRCWPAWVVDRGTGPLGHPHHQVLASLGGGQRDGASRSRPSPGAGQPGWWTEGQCLLITPWPV
nr:spidroin-1-like [Pongo abelii]